MASGPTGAPPAQFYMPPAYSPPPNYPISAKRAMWSDLLYDMGSIMQGQAPTSPHRTRMAAQHLMAQQRAQQMRAAAANRYKFQEVGDRLYQIDQSTGEVTPRTDASEEPAFEGTGMPAQMLNGLTSPDPNLRRLAFTELAKPKQYTTADGRTYTVPGMDAQALNGMIQQAGYEPFGTGAADAGAAGATGAGAGASPSGVPLGVTQKPPTEAQSRVLGFFDQMVGAQRQLADVAGTEGFDPTSVLTRIISADGPISSFANYAASPEEQRYARAAERWIRGKLRRESGAVIGAEEAAQEFRAFFPMPGDDEQTRRDKEVARARALRSMGSQAGPAYEALGALDQTYIRDDGQLVTREDIEETARARGADPEEVLRQAIEAGAVRPLVGG
jgi:hypothetical protein